MMIKNIAYLALACLLTAGSAARAADGVRCGLSVFQWDNRANADVLLFCDTAEFVVGRPATGFLVAFSVEIEFTGADSNQCSFQVHTVTLGQPANNYARQYRVEYGLPARMGEITGKGGARYALVISPLDRVDINTTVCEFDHHKEDVFRFDPSGYMDIYYVPNSFGDFYWNTVKGIMEERYRLFKAINNFTLPGKYTIYLCPCRVHSVIWDKRFGMMVDPTRNVAFAQYNKDINTADPFLVLHASVYRNYGYAPAFISEGLASYLSFAAFEMRELIKAGKNIPLANLLNTYYYYTADPIAADRTSATFVKYLIDQYTVDKLLQVYREADDLNLLETIETVYQKPLDELETEWLRYVDTVSISTEQLVHYADLAEAMFDFGMMRHYSQALLQQAADTKDSMEALGYLVRASFSYGDYYGATSYQERLVQIQDSLAVHWMALAGYDMMNGQYEKAAASLERAHAIDSSDQLVQFNLALYALYRGDEPGAKQLLAGIIFRSDRGAPLAESRVMLGHLLIKSGDEEERALANQYFLEAVNHYAQSIGGGLAAPTAHLWTGMAYLGLGDTGNAYDFLNTALFLEKRPFYENMAHLWLGKVADVMSEHDVARDHYGHVLAGASADYHQKEARQYLKDPYRQ